MLVQETDNRIMQGTNDFLAASQEEAEGLGIWSKQGTASQDGGSRHQTYQERGKRADGTLGSVPRGAERQ